MKNAVTGTKGAGRQGLHILFFPEPIGNIRVKLIYVFICYCNEVLIMCSIVFQQSLRIEFLR